MTSGGRDGFPGEVSYGAAKAALESYTLSAAQELGRFGITANVIHPPATDTGWISPAIAEFIEREDILGRIGQPAGRGRGDRLAVLGPRPLRLDERHPHVVTTSGNGCPAMASPGRRLQKAASMTSSSPPRTEATSKRISRGRRRGRRRATARPGAGARAASSRVTASAGSAEGVRRAGLHLAEHDQSGPRAATRSSSPSRQRQLRASTR